MTTFATVSKWYSFNLNANIYQAQINAFSVENKYPVPQFFSADKQTIISGNLKLNNQFYIAKSIDIQISALYLAPDIIPQGKIGQRFSLNIGAKKSIQKGKGELFINANDILNTLLSPKQVQGNGFHYTTRDYYETQVVRLGYNYKF